VYQPSIKVSRRSSPRLRRNAEHVPATAFEGREKLSHIELCRRRDRSQHGRATGFPATFAECQDVYGALVAVMDDAVGSAGRSPVSSGIQHSSGLQMMASTAEDLAAPASSTTARSRKRLRRYEGDVRHPELVGRAATKFRSHQITGRSGFLVPRVVVTPERGGLAPTRPAAANQSGRCG